MNSLKQAFLIVLFSTVNVFAVKERNFIKEKTFPVLLSIRFYEKVVYSNVSKEYTPEMNEKLENEH